MPSLEQDQLRQWALRGAEQRLLDIAEEAAAIHRAFPELRRRGNGIPVARASRAGQSATASTATGRRGRGRRRMSADARRRISEAQKARWAKQRGDKPAVAVADAAPQARAAKKTRRRGGARKMSAAARKRISEAQKARWAKQKAAKKKAA
jgi:hypothetical protein